MAYKTYDLDTLTLQRLDMDVSDANRTAYSAQFLQSYNEAYAKICTERLVVQEEEPVELSSTKRFALTELSYATQRGYVLWVRPSASYASPNYKLTPNLEFHYERYSGAEYVVVPGATASTSVMVKYRYIPTALANATPTTAGSGSTPSLLPDWLQPALVEYAAYQEFKRQRKFERMQVALEAYERLIAQVTPPVEAFEGVHDIVAGGSLNAYQLDTLVLDEVGADPNRVEFRAKFASMFLAAYNDAYADLCERFIRPFKTATVTLSGKKYFLKNLTDKVAFGGVWAVTNTAKTVTYGFRYSERWEIEVPEAGATDDVLIQYRYDPAPIENPNPQTGASATTPAELPSYMHALLRHKAVAAYWRFMGDNARAEAAEAVYQAETAKLKPRDMGADNIVPSGSLTAYQLDTLAMLECGLDAENPEARMRYSPIFLQEYNLAYSDLCLKYFKPITTASLTTSASSVLDLTELSASPTHNGLIRITSDAGAVEHSFKYTGPSTISVIPAAPSTSVQITYQQEPTPIANPSPVTGTGATAPTLLPKGIHSALRYKAVAKYWQMENDQKRSEAAEQRYRDAIAGFDPKVFGQAALVGTGALSAYTLDTLTLIACGLDATDQTIRQRYSPLFLTEYNAAYTDLCERYVKLFTTEEITLSAGAGYYLKSAGKSVALNGVMSVTNTAKTETYGFRYTDRWEIKVSGAAAGSSVLLTYRYDPTPIENPHPTHGSGATAPTELPAHMHPLLWRRATIAYMRLFGDAARAELQEAQYRAGIEKLQPRDMGSDAIIPGGALTAYQLDSLVMNEVGLDAENPEARLRYSPVFLQAYNSAYSDLCRRFFQPIITATLTTETAPIGAPYSTLDISTLDEKPAHNGLMRITNANRTAEFSFSYISVDQLAITPTAPETQVLVTYQYIPDPIANPSPVTGTGATTPALMPSDMHVLLTHKGVAAYWHMEGNLQRADAAEAAYKAATETLEPRLYGHAPTFDPTVITTYTLDTLALIDCGLDYGNPAVRTRWAPLFLAEYNQAYAQLCADIIKPNKIETVALDANNEFITTTTLTSMPTTDGIEQITDEAETIAYDFYYTNFYTVRVPCAAASSNIKVKYQYVPAALVNPAPTIGTDATAPTLLPAQYRPALHYKAAAAYWRTQGDTNRMMAMERAYADAILPLRQRRDSGSHKVRSVYGYYLM